MSEVAYILLGSNLGDREHNLASARELVSQIEGCELIASSSIYLSEAVDMAADSPSFMNQVLKLEYGFTAHELLHQCEEIEQRLGRTDKGLLQPRIIDIDILLFGDQIISYDDLIVPHPRMIRRPFALLPLLEIDPGLVHPVSGRRLSEYVKPKDAAAVMLYKDHVARTN